MKELSERRITSAPSEQDRAKCRTFAYVGEEPLSTRERVNVHCNCGSLAPYETASRSNVCQCPDCGTTIGLYGVSGGPGSVPYRTLDGSTGEVPIQGFDENSG